MRPPAFSRLLSFILPFVAPVFAHATSDTPIATDPFWFEPVTVERVRSLPATEQAPWFEYLKRSELLAARDHAFLEADVKAAGLQQPTRAPKAVVFGVNLRQPLAWFATPEGRQITANIISYQTPAGGWGKRLDLGAGPRPPGGDFVSESRGQFFGTFDNNATTTQLRALARAIQATGDQAASAAFARGLDYIFAAQYPNGGWPQVYPLDGGYHDAITFNDQAMVNILEFLEDVAAGEHEYSFVTPEIRAEAARRVQRGIACLLATQVVVDGRLTAWCQQHDALTLRPCGARAFEMLSLCSAESAQILGFLINQPNPDPAMRNAIQHAAAWLKQRAIRGYEWKKDNAGEYRFLPSTEAASSWARLYEIGTNRPVFGDRDKLVHYDVNEISAERRNGYAWYVSGPAETLRKYHRKSR